MRGGEGVKIEGSPKEIADFLQHLQDQQFKNGVRSLGDAIVTDLDLHGNLCEIYKDLEVTEL